ncbi:MAG TPA: transposase family protein [Herpetosiphonaceae bacterium]|nr:transposase family protein [Herpetosiphonaceae bacterium]
MDQAQYTKGMTLIAGVPDPRHPRGKQLEWAFIWGVIVTALLSQQHTPAAIAQWAKRQASTLLATFQPARGRVPSESTIRRALQRVDVAALERHLACRGYIHHPSVKLRWMVHVATTGTR